MERSGMPCSCSVVSKGSWESVPAFPKHWLHLQNGVGCWICPTFIAPVHRFSKEGKTQVGSIKNPHSPNKTIRYNRHHEDSMRENRRPEIPTWKSAMCFGNASRWVLSTGVLSTGRNSKSLLQEFREVLSKQWKREVCKPKGMAGTLQDRWGKLERLAKINT